MKNPLVHHNHQHQHADIKQQQRKENEVVSTAIAGPALHSSPISLPSSSSSSSSSPPLPPPSPSPPPPSSWKRLTSLPPAAAAAAAAANITSNCPRDCQQPLTVFAKLLIQPGFEREFEQWYHDITKLQQDHWPGYLSSELVKPMAYSHEYISIFRYDSYEHLEAWMISSQRHEMLLRAKEFSKAPPQLTYHSLEFWFVPHRENDDDDDGDNGHTGAGGVDETMYPEEENGDSGAGGKQKLLPPQAQPRPPAKYKMVLVTFLVIWATNQWTGRVLMRILGQDTVVPKVVLQGLTTFFTVVVAAFIGLPLATGILGFWLFPHQSYMTSLRGGFMSLPWPIPNLITRWFLTTTTTTTTTTPKVNNKNSISNHSATADAKQKETSSTTTTTTPPISTTTGMQGREVEDEDEEDVDQLLDQTEKQCQTIIRSNTATITFKNADAKSDYEQMGKSLHRRQGGGSGGGGGQNSH